ncbi:uncharacterized protein ARMOST_20375 [Armillaria ostoyae]|uniref:Uncharacterized protein n=1 Tax=Armillaria ostoyae TaxID=47428 RepID=A0A284S7A2_ARMOS|nr:uncharacterized protein ARMOST_20375 [Armillaria ostoyae]
MDLVLCHVDQPTKRDIVGGRSLKLGARKYRACTIGLGSTAIEAAAWVTNILCFTERGDEERSHQWTNISTSTSDNPRSRHTRSLWVLAEPSVHAYKIGNQYGAAETKLSSSRGSGHLVSHAGIQKNKSVALVMIQIRASGTEHP